MQTFTVCLCVLVIVVAVAVGQKQDKQSKAGGNGGHRIHIRRPRNETRGRESLKKHGHVTDDQLDKIKAAHLRRSAKVLKKYAAKKNVNVNTPRFDEPREGEPEDLPYLNQDVADFMTEGDMFLSAEQLESEEENARRKRKAASNPSTKWSTVSAIPYFFDASLTAQKQAVIVQSIAFWEANTCLKFQQLAADPGVSSLRFFSGAGCYSYVGKVFLTAQDISIGDGCEYLGIVTHEIGHALGFYHEQSRYDRDSYINVNVANVVSQAVQNYDKASSADMTNYNIRYDYGSVMHYASTDFALNASIFVMTPKGNAFYQQTMGQRAQPSFLDVLEMNRHYGCDALCIPSTSAQCSNGGYADPLNCQRCKCPSGFGGQLCADVLSAMNGVCGGVLTATTQWKTLSATVGTVALDDAPTTCFWQIKSPASKVIETKVQFTGWACSKGCFWTAVEIKAFNDFQPAGYRICCPEDTNNGNNVYKSQGNLVPIIAYGSYQTSFVLQYRYVNANG